MAFNLPADHPLNVQVGGSHYRDMKIQPAEFIMANNVPWAEGSILQYVVRWRVKGGVDDLKKAKHLIDMLIAKAEIDTAGADRTKDDSSTFVVSRPFVYTT